MNDRIVAFDIMIPGEFLVELFDDKTMLRLGLRESK